MTIIQAVTFDLWDTIVHDESDEPKRRAQGLKSKKEERRHLIWQALNRHEPISLETVSQACDVADAAFATVWHDLQVTCTLLTRIRVVLRGLRRTLPENELDDVIRAYEAMEIDVPPDIIPGCAEALADLSQRYKLAIVSDAVFTPGRRLRDLLELHGVKKYFSGFAFSDEVGHSKPHRDMFASAAEQLGVSLDAMVHIGDRQHNDIEGSHALGMRAVLFTATRDVDNAGNTADAVCEAYSQLPAIIDALARGCSGKGPKQ